MFTGGHEGSAAQGSGDVGGQTPRELALLAACKTRNGVGLLLEEDPGVGSSLLTSLHRRGFLWRYVPWLSAPQAGTNRIPTWSLAPSGAPASKAW